MKTVSRDGVELWWSEEGEGTPVVLVPGRGDATDIFPTRFSAVLVNADCRVVRFDPRDTGLSGVGSDTYTMTDMADDVLAVLDDAGVPAAHFVGLSMAGLLLVDIASRIPDRILSMTFLSALSPDPDAGIGEDFFEMIGDNAAVAIIGAMGQTSEADREWVEREVAAAARRSPYRPDAAQRHQDTALRSAWPTPASLLTISAPCLAIHGTEDRKLPLAHGQAFANAIADCELVTMDGMGHLPRPDEWDTIASLVVRLGRS